MAGKIFYRERRKVKDGEKKPRFRMVGVFDCNLKIYAKHLRLSELEHLAEALAYMPILRTNHVVQGFIPANSWTQDKNS
jgi:hypothetical protein